MSEPVEVRIARDTDLPTIAAAFGDEWFFRDRLVRQQLGHGELFVAWRHDAPVGNVYLWRERPFEAPVRARLGWTPTINHLEVLPAWRDRGIGTVLVRAAEEHASGLGYWRLGLGVGVDNVAAQRLYERLGYADWGHGLVEAVWQEPDPDGGFHEVSLSCFWLVRQLTLDAPSVEAWAAWSPDEAYRRLRSSTVDWYVAGGWALDLWLGHQSRDHEDLEVAIDRTHFPSWRAHLAEHPLYDVGSGRLRRLGANEAPDPTNHQVWLRDLSEPVWRLDTFLEDRPDGRWACHWLPSVRHPMSLAVMRTRSGIPYLRPELVLLGKAKHCRPKDEADLRATLPTLDDEAVARLRAGLVDAPAPAGSGTLDDPHPWLALLER